LVLAAQGEYRSALDLLRGIDEETVKDSQAGVIYPMVMSLNVELRVRQHDPFGFIADVQRATLDQIAQARG
jgi:hypothetical protein